MITKIRLTSKFMMSQAGLQYILLNISQSTEDQSVKLGQLIEIFFFKNNAENEARKLVTDLFLFFKKT